MKLRIVFIAFFAVANAAQAQINKCVDATGKTVYSQGPCPKGAKASAVAPAPTRAAPTSAAATAMHSGSGAVSLPSVNLDEVARGLPIQNSVGQPEMPVVKDRIGARQYPDSRK